VLTCLRTYQLTHLIYLATDHRGFELKEKIKGWLKEWGYAYEDMGALVYDEDDDYPDFISKAAEKVSQEPENSKAIILGGSGQGEAMAANRYKGVRAAVFYGPPFQFKRMPWYKWLFPGIGIKGMAGTYGKAEIAILQDLVKLSRQHNNANVLSLGTFFIDMGAAKKIIKLWLETSFSGEERHKRRLAKF